MKLSAYRDSLIKLTDQVLADYQLQALLQPTSTTSPYFGKNMKEFAETVFNSINSPQVLTTSTMGGTPIPNLTDLDTLPGKNVFDGDIMAPNLRTVPVAPFVTNNTQPEHKEAEVNEVGLLNGMHTADMSRGQLISLLQSALSAHGGAPQKQSARV